jgi:hypothetical protein
MTPPSATAIILFILAVAGIYQATFWNRDHGSAATVPARSVDRGASEAGTSADA